MRKPVVLTACMAVWLCACSQQAALPEPAQIAAAEKAMPGDPGLSRIYQRSCISCHSVSSSTAPLTGFAAAWKPRLQQGMPVLVQHAREGYKAMPAKGFCSDCSDQDLQKLIEFMSTPINKDAT
jgi:cytochrome c5